MIIWLHHWCSKSYRLQVSRQSDSICRLREDLQEKVQIYLQKGINFKIETPHGVFCGSDRKGILRTLQRSIMWVRTPSTAPLSNNNPYHVQLQLSELLKRNSWFSMRSRRNTQLHLYANSWRTHRDVIQGRCMGMSHIQLWFSGAFMAPLRCRRTVRKAMTTLEIVIMVSTLVPTIKRGCFDNNPLLWSFNYFT